MDKARATTWAQRRLKETGRPIAVAILSETTKAGDRDGATTWSALLTDGRDVVDFTLVGRRSFTDAEDRILRAFPEGTWLESVREKGEVSLL
jgi:urease gamma subunit